ncbi:MAG: hypothetical protein J7641_21885 [Cyanobacteria bacterium SID2]|nr:hypothetical protein [Cyanobacteria bacterium SID2]MBP0004790.1 hypothetical protein [Cyanobacteria bacterium SBC]
MNEITANQMRERLGNIDQIRDILFGDKTREYERQFQQVQSELTVLRDDLTGQIESLKSNFSSDLRRAIDALEKKIQYVNSSLDQESGDLHNQLESLESRFSSNLVIVEKSLKNQVNGLQEDLIETRDRLDEEVRSLKAQILTELDKRSHQLQGDKLSRADFAEILFDVCMRVKGKDRETDGSDSSQDKTATLLLPERQNDYQNDPLE